MTSDFGCLACNANVERYVISLGTRVCFRNAEPINPTNKLEGWTYSLLYFLIPFKRIDEIENRTILWRGNKRPKIVVSLCIQCF